MINFNSNFPQGNSNKDITFILKYSNKHFEILISSQASYNAIDATEEHWHMRRLLWRWGETTKPWSVYVLKYVHFGDRPAAAIASTAVRKTAEIFEAINPKAAERIVRDSYVDDIATGEDDNESVDELREGIREILRRGGFEVKGFIKSGD